MKNTHIYTPFARYALIALATKLVSGGVLPDNLAQEIAADPALIEFVAGLLLYGATGLWYYWSTARKALMAAID